ncbi:uncharacterized protein LOC126973727 [Leptidea sinapis]|uniref:uncharacterized protein LOC126973727 n=1 Tax=Leptidea sinapis TaxID=189913 RepID=UPI0021C3BB2F|nr:uncharacterized protein LOC126973727 [Leptidea sinapis]
MIETGIEWRYISQAVRKAKMPMVPGSIAKILCKFVSKNLTPEELAETVSKFRLIYSDDDNKFQPPPLSDSSDITDLADYEIESKEKKLTRKRERNPHNWKVGTMKLGDLIYISVQMKSTLKDGPVLYIATPPGQPVALVSSVRSWLLKHCVRGLGYQTFENALLHGKDKDSLLRAHNPMENEVADHLAERPEYRPIPCITRGGIDYTGMTNDEEYVKRILGPNPPILTELSITTEKDIYDPTEGTRRMKMTFELKSKNIAKTLQEWVAKGAIAPTSELFYIFNEIKSNKIMIDNNN